MSETILKVENLTKRYKNARGAFDVSITLQRGDSFGLLGANGAGKTTVMKMITGLCRATEGNVEILGHDLESDHEAAMSHIGAVIESPAFYPYLSAMENLRLAARYYPQANYDQTALESILDSVGLLPYQKEKTSRFSLGMKQRLALALSMIGSPALYVLDEPSNGLDIEGRVDIRNIITSLSSSGNSTFLISSHLSEEIEKTCNVVGVMKDGYLRSIEEMDVILSQYPNLETYYLQQISTADRRAS